MLKMKMKPDVERLGDMADNVQCAPYAPGDTTCTVYGPQLKASVAGAVRQRCGRVGPDQAPGEQQHSVHVAVWL